MISLWEFIVRGKKQKYKLFANARHIRTNRIDILSTFLIYHGEMFRANAMDICNYPKNDKNSCEKLLLRIDVRVREVKFYKLEWTRQVECKLWMVVKSRGQGLEVYLAAVAKWYACHWSWFGMRVDRGSKGWLVGCCESGFRTDYVTHPSE